MLPALYHLIVGMVEGLCLLGSDLSVVSRSLALLI